MVPNTERGVDILDELLISEETTLQFIQNRKGLHRDHFFKKYFAIFLQNQYIFLIALAKYFLKK